MKQWNALQNLKATGNLGPPVEMLSLIFTTLFVVHNICSWHMWHKQNTWFYCINPFVIISLTCWQNGISQFQSSSWNQSELGLLPVIWICTTTKYAVCLIVKHTRGTQDVLVNCFAVICSSFPVTFNNQRICVFLPTLNMNRLSNYSS